MDTILRKHDRSIAASIVALSSELVQTQRLDAHTRPKPHACRMRSERIRCIGLVTRVNGRGDCFDALLRASKVLSKALGILNNSTIHFCILYYIIFTNNIIFFYFIHYSNTEIFLRPSCCSRWLYFTMPFRWWNVVKQEVWKWLTNNFEYTMSRLLKHHFIPYDPRQKRCIFHFSLHSALHHPQEKAPSELLPRDHHRERPHPTSSP